MSFTVRLIPKLGDPREVLQPGLTERRELVLDSNNDGGGIIVGRGTLTGICDSDVDEEAFRLTFNEHCYTQHLVLVSNMAPETSNLYVNGLPWDEYQEHIYLGHGEVISLDGLRYEYKVHIETTYSNDLGKKRKADSEDVISVLSNSPEPKETLDSLAASKCEHAPSSAGTVIAEESASRISEEIQCSVCLDIQVHSRTCSPCGHSFCASCVAKLDQCPQCRKEIVSHVPAVQLDGLIAALIHVPNLLEKDDVEHYKERVAAAQQVRIEYCRLDASLQYVISLATIVSYVKDDSSSAKTASNGTVRRQHPGL